MAAEVSPRVSRWRSILAWLVSVGLLLAYGLLPSGRSGQEPPPLPASNATSSRLDVQSISPAHPYPGGIIVIAYSNSNGEPLERVDLGKEELPILSRQPNKVVAQLPDDVEVGRAKVRVQIRKNRSKPFDINIELRDWRRPFRDFLGGLALMVFGIGLFARGSREALGKSGADRLGRHGRNALAAFGLGSVVGALSQSTIASAALIAALSASSLTTSSAAAAAFLGAQLGAGTLPLATGLLDLRAGLLVVAIGVLWSVLARDRRASALARLLLGLGFVTFGMYLIRSGLEPLLIDDKLLAWTAGLHADTLTRRLLCFAVGVVLVALLQGAASALLVAAGLLQMVGQLELNVLLYVLAGSGLGAALSALVTTRTDARGRRLTQLYLLLALASSVISFVTVDLWAALASALTSAQEPLARFGANPLSPTVSPRLAWALVFSQLGSTLTVLPLVGVLGRWLKRTQAQRGDDSDLGGSLEASRSGLLSVLGQQKLALQSISQLALAGERAAGREAEHGLSGARVELEALLSRVARALPAGASGLELRQAAFACLQLQRSLEDLLYRAERFVDRQVAVAARGGGLPDVTELQTTTREMQRLLEEALDVAEAALGNERRVDLGAAQAREIRLNALEAQSRRAALEASGDSRVIQARLDLLELFDAYESAGNHLYRLAETLSGGVSPHRVASG